MDAVFFIIQLLWWVNNVWKRHCHLKDKTGLFFNDLKDKSGLTQNGKKDVI